ncbi:MAG TPA: FtsX-like permease family protein, partial [Desulfobacteria bacterium]|nr:FtsX-like permease family protein [Desulfobacteria bacterium]
RMKRWWKVQGNKPAGPGDVLLGSQAAGELNKKTGDKLEVKGKTYTVTGIIEETGNQEDMVIFMDLNELQTITGKSGTVSFVEVSALCSTCPIEDITAQISGKIPGTKVSAIKEVVQARKDFVDRFAQMGIYVSIIVLVVGSLVVLITMMSSVSERTREIGIFRAIGFRKGHVISVILMESGMISIVGGIAGYLAGMAAAIIVAPVIAQMEVKIPWDFKIALAAMVIAVGMGLAASVFPALKASRQDPVEALRFI